MLYLSQEEVHELKSLIVRAGLDIGAVAVKMGMSRATLSSRINGKTDFTRSEMEKFAFILGKPPSSIFFAA